MDPSDSFHDLMEAKDDKKRVRIELPPIKSPRSPRNPTERQPSEENHPSDPPERHESTLTVPEYNQDICFSTTQRPSVASTDGWIKKISSALKTPEAANLQVAMPGDGRCCYGMCPPKRNIYWKDRLTSFADGTSVVGVGTFHRRECYVRKAVWFLLFLAAWVLAWWQGATAIQKYLQYNTTVSIKVSYNRDIDFPAVTLCNINPLRKSEYESLKTTKWTSAELGVDYVEYAENKQPSLMAWELQTFEPESLDTDEALKNKIHVELYNLTLNGHLNITESGHRLQDILLNCLYDGIQCELDDFKLWGHGRFGNCYTFYANQSKYGTKTRSGPQHGLSLTLNTQTDEYIESLNTATGFQVTIHTKDKIPFPQELGFTVSPGISSLVGIRREHVERLPLPYDGIDCIEKHQRSRYAKDSMYTHLEPALGITSTYTFKGCLNTCMMNHLVASCDCVDPRLTTPRIARLHFNRSIKACEIYESDMLKCYREIPVDTCDVLCPQPCETDDFLRTTTSSLWPSDPYIIRHIKSWSERGKVAVSEHLMEKIFKRYGVLEVLPPGADIPVEEVMSGKFEMPPGSPYTVWELRQALLIEIRNNLAHLAVYFQELNFQSITESAATSFIDLLIDLGGTAGFWVGMCTLTVFEIVELFLDLALITYYKKI